MLIITTKPNETITITLPSNEVLIIELTSIEGNSARIGIEALEHIKIEQTELIDCANLN